MSYEQVSKDLEKVIGYIHSDELTDDEKKLMTEQTLDYFDNYVSPGWLKYRKSVSTNSAVLEWKDHDGVCDGLYGEEFIDCLGGFGIYTCGHRNPEILDTVKAQLDHQALHSQELLDPLRGYLAKAVADITPGDLQYCFFTNGGAEAVEMALKLARIATGGRWYISTVGAFHGKSMGAISMGGKNTYRVPYTPMVQQVQHVEYGNAEDARKAIRNLIAVGEKVAAMIVEPIQGEAGVIVPPEGYLTELRQICDEYGVALIFDEIQCGYGRTGKMWASEHFDVVPDIMTVGKAIAGGLPMSAVISTPEIMDKWPIGTHGTTFGGNPCAAAAGNVVLDAFEDGSLLKNVNEMGAYLKEKLREMQSRHSCISDVRGLGLMVAIEFSHEDGSPAPDLWTAVKAGCLKRHMLTLNCGVYGNGMRFATPLNVKKEEIDEGLQILEKAICEVEAG